MKFEKLDIVKKAVKMRQLLTNSSIPLWINGKTGLMVDPTTLSYSVSKFSLIKVIVLEKVRLKAIFIWKDWDTSRYVNIILVYFIYWLKFLVMPLNVAEIFYSGIETQYWFVLVIFSVLRLE